MRQIATLPDAEAAHKVADYLLTLQIETRLEQDGGGWALWVCDEDRVPQARQELEEFTRNPHDPRYAGARRTARTLREKESREEAAYRRRQVFLRDGFQAPASRRLPLTLALLLASVAVALATRLGDVHTSLFQALAIAPFLGENGVGWNGLEQVRHGQVWRLVTPIFLHFGPLHLLFNLLMLYRLGGAVEARRGSGRLLGLVLAIAVLSNVAQFYFGTVVLSRGHLVFLENPSFGGMSGVVYGLFGYVWMKAWFDPGLGLTIDRNTVLVLLAWFVLCLTGLIGSVANMAHAVGLAVGLAAGYVPTLWRSR
jgi:GlpG protein